MKRVQIIAILLLACAVMESYQILGIHRHKQTDDVCNTMQDRCRTKLQASKHRCKKVRKMSSVCRHNRVNAIPCMNTCLSTCDGQNNVFTYARCLLMCEKGCPTRLSADYSDRDRNDDTSHYPVRRISWLEQRHRRSHGSRRVHQNKDRPYDSPFLPPLLAQPQVPADYESINRNNKARAAIVPEAREVCQNFVNDCLAVVDRQKEIRNVERDTQKVNCKRIGGRARECLKDVQENVRCFDTCRSNCHDANTFNDWHICLETCSEPCFRHDRNPDMYQKLPLDMVSSFVIARCYLKADKATQVERCHDLERRENDLKDSVNPYQNCMDGCIDNYINGETTIEYCLAGCPAVIERERQEDPKHKKKT